MVIPAQPMCRSHPRMSWFMSGLVVCRKFLLSRLSILSTTNPFSFVRMTNSLTAVLLFRLRAPRLIQLGLARNVPSVERVRCCDDNIHHRRQARPKQLQPQLSPIVASHSRILHRSFRARRHHRSCLGCHPAVVRLRRRVLHRHGDPRHQSIQLPKLRHRRRLTPSQCHRHPHRTRVACRRSLRHHIIDPLVSVFWVTLRRLMTSCRRRQLVRLLVHLTYPHQPHRRSEV